MNDEIIKLKIEEHEREIKKNTKDISTLKIENTAQNGKIDNLCDKMMLLNDSIKGLVMTLKWGMGILVTIFVPILMFLMSKK